MSPQFTINFRREAYLRELDRARRRVNAIVIWLSYFGVIAVIAGLFVLNAVALQGRVQDLQERIARFQAHRPALRPWDVPAGELASVERFVRNPRRWHARLTRLAALTPPDLAVTSLAVNPDNLPGHEHDDELVITGTLRPRSGEDHLEGIMAFVAKLQADPGFSTGYSTVRLTQSQAARGPSGNAEFTIECR